MRSHRIIKATTILRTPRERRSAPKKSMSFSEKDLRWGEVLTDSGRILDFAVLETVFRKKPAAFCINTSIENAQFYTRDRSGKLSCAQNTKGRRCLAPTPLGLITLPRLPVASTEFFQNYP